MTHTPPIQNLQRQRSQSFTNKTIAITPLSSEPIKRERAQSAEVDFSPINKPLSLRKVEQFKTHLNLSKITQEELNQYKISPEKAEKITTISFMGANKDEKNYDITEIPKGFLAQFINLKSLNLGGTKIDRIPVEEIKNLPLTALNLQIDAPLKEDFSLKDLKTLFYKKAQDPNNPYQEQHQKESDFELTLNQYSAPRLLYSQNLESIKKFHIILPSVKKGVREINKADISRNIIALLNLLPEKKTEIIQDLSKMEISKAVKKYHQIFSDYNENGKFDFSPVNILQHPENSKRNWEALPTNAYEFLENISHEENNPIKISKEFYKQTGLWPLEYQEVIRSMNLQPVPHPEGIFTGNYKKAHKNLQTKENGTVNLPELTYQQLLFLIHADKNPEALKKLIINSCNDNPHLTRLPDLTKYPSLTDLEIKTNLTTLDITKLPSSLKKITIQSKTFNQLSNISKNINKIIISNEDPEPDLEKFLQNNIPLPKGLEIADSNDDGHPLDFEFLHQYQLKIMMHDETVNFEEINQAIKHYLNNPKKLEKLPSLLENKKEIIFQIYPEIKEKAEYFEKTITHYNSKEALQFDNKKSVDEIATILQYVNPEKIKAIYLDNIKSLKKIPDLSRFNKIEKLHISSTQDLSSINENILKKLKNFKIKIDDEAHFDQVEAFMKELSKNIFHNSSSFSLIIRKKGVKPLTIPLTSHNYKNVTLYITLINLMPPTAPKTKLDFLLKYQKDWDLNLFENNQKPEKTGFKTSADFIKILKENKILQQHLENIAQFNIFNQRYQNVLKTSIIEGLNDKQKDFFQAYLKFYKLTDQTQPLEETGKESSSIHKPKASREPINDSLLQELKIKIQSKGKKPSSFLKPAAKKTIEIFQNSKNFTKNVKLEKNSLILPSGNYKRDIATFKDMLAIARILKQKRAQVTEIKLDGTNFEVNEKDLNFLRKIFPNLQKLTKKKQNFNFAIAPSSGTKKITIPHQEKRLNQTITSLAPILPRNLPFSSPIKATSSVNTLNKIYEQFFFCPSIFLGGDPNILLNQGNWFQKRLHIFAKILPPDIKEILSQRELNPIPLATASKSPKQTWGEWLSSGLSRFFMHLLIPKTYGTQPYKIDAQPIRKMEEMFKNQQFQQFQQFLKNNTQSSTQHNETTEVPSWNASPPSASTTSLANNQVKQETFIRNAIIFLQELFNAYDPGGS